MSLKTRRILFILFVIAFLSITPLVMSYAVGYKLSFSGKIIQKTGMLILDSEPKGAKVYINGKPRQLFFKKYFHGKENFIVTPAKIKNLLPGEYNIKLKKEGYNDWQKKLEIMPGMSTFAEDINLFKKNLPFFLSDGNINQILPSPDHKLLAIVKDEELNIFNFETENEIFSIKKKLNSDSSEFSSFSWSPNSEKILFNSTIYYINNQTEKLALNDFISLNSSQLQWLDDNQISFLPPDKKSVNIFDLTSRKKKRIIANKNIINFFFKDSHLIFVEQDVRAANLIVYDIDSERILRNIELPSLSKYKFINQDNKLINLYDEKYYILYLINPFARFPLEETINNVKHAYWPLDNTLLYANDFEIWMAEFNIERSGQKKLLTRISNPINNILWHPSNNYVIYSTDDTIYTIELDDREKRNITELIKLDNISLLFLNKKGDILYFYAEIGKQAGLYKLIIQ